MLILAELLQAHTALTAADDGTSTAVTGTFVQLGAIGTLALMLLWFALGAYRREVQRNDTLTAEVRALNAEIRTRDAELRDRYVPTMTEVVRVLSDVTAVMRERR